MMKYYDIHTHQLSVRPDNVAIVNLEPTRKETGLLSDEIRNFSEWNRCSIGIHPWHLEDVENRLKEMEALLALPQVVAIGEAGLDKRIKSPMPFQQEVFLSQARLAEEVNKPVIIHCVKAWQEIVLAHRTVMPSVPWVIHGFRGNGTLAAQLVRQGFYLSFGEYFNPEAVHAAWPDKLLAETDDKSVDIRSVYQKLAQSLAVDEQAFVWQVIQNITRLGLNK